MKHFYPVLFLLLAICFRMSGQVTLTPIPLTKVGIGTTCIETLGSIVLTESNDDDFTEGASPVTYFIDLPTGFEFVSTNSGDPTDATGINVAYDVITAGTGTFTLGTKLFSIPGAGHYRRLEIQYTNATNNEVGRITISNIQVRCYTPGNSGNITRSGGSAAILGNVNGAVLGQLTNINGTFTILRGTPGGQFPLTGNWCRYDSLGISSTLTGFVGTGYTHTLWEDGAATAKSSDYVGFNRISGFAPMRANFANYPLTNYPFVLESSNGTCTYRTNTITYTVNAIPEATATNSAPTIFTTTSDAAPLSNFLTLPPNTTYDYGYYTYSVYTKRNGTFTSGIGGIAPSLYFIPSSAGEGEHTLYYGLKSTIGFNGCRNLFTAPFKFTVVNPLNPQPFFVDPPTTPICENAGMLNYVASTPSPLSSIFSIVLHYKGGDVTIPASGGSTQAFQLDPSRRRDNFIIPITLNTDVGSILDTFYIFPRRKPNILGLPTAAHINDAANTDTVYVCAASKDTIEMRGISNGGSFEFYVINKLTGANKATFPPNNNYYNFFTVDPNDPSFVRLTPSRLFGSGLYFQTNPADAPNTGSYRNLDTSEVVKIIYTYPGLGSGLCPDRKIVFLKFYRPTNLRYTTISPLVLPYCYGDTLRIQAINVQAQDSVAVEFGDGSPSSGWRDANEIFSHPYNRPGYFYLRFKTKRVGAICNNDRYDYLRIGAKPTVNFDVFNNYEDSVTRFRSTSTILVPNLLIPNDTIYLHTWKFGTGAIANTAAIKNANYTYTSVPKLPYPVTLVVRAGTGCQDSLTRYIPIFPVHTPTQTSSVLDSFNTADLNGWYNSEDYRVDTISSWENTTPGGSKIIAGDGDAWITSGNTSDSTSTYYNNERSYVESPIYKLDSLSLPMVSLSTIEDFDNLFDGASVQYAFVDNLAFGKETWHTLGRDKRGLNWYNSRTIIGRPGDNLLGWTGDTSTTWVNSAYPLNDLVDSTNLYNKKLIRFRVVLGTNGDNTPIEGKTFEGFGFDNFFVGQRNRRVLVEEFCDYINHEPLIPSRLTSPQVIRIQYHVRSRVLNDDINNQNKAEPSARLLHYGFDEPNRGVIDGIFIDYDKAFLSWGEEAFTRRSLYVSPFDIGIQWDTVGQRLNVSASIHKNSTRIINGPFIIQLAVLEAAVEGNGTVFTNVLRNMLPDAGGHYRNLNWQLNHTETVSGSWSPFADPESELLLVAFIQDDFTKEVYQANMDTVSAAIAQALFDNASGRIATGNAGFNDLTLYPNPTSGNVNMLLNGVAKVESSFRIFDAMGRRVMHGTLPAGTHWNQISLAGIGTGIYSLIVENGENVIKKSFAVTE